MDKERGKPLELTMRTISTQLDSTPVTDSSSDINHKTYNAINYVNLDIKRTVLIKQIDSGYVKSFHWTKTLNKPQKTDIFFVFGAKSFVKCFANSNGLNMLLSHILSCILLHLANRKFLGYSI